MKYTRKVSYLKEGDKFDKAFKKLPKKQKEAILKISSAQKEQERKDKLSSVGAGFQKPATSAINMPTRTIQVENTVGQPYTKTRGQGERLHTKTAEEGAERKAKESKTSAGNTGTDVPGQSFVPRRGSLGNRPETNISLNPKYVNGSPYELSGNEIVIPQIPSNYVFPEITEAKAEVEPEVFVNPNLAGSDYQNMPISVTTSNTPYPITKPRKNSFIGNITSRSTTPIVNIAGTDGKVWQGTRYRNLGPAQFAELKSGQDTWSRRVLNNEHYYTLNGREIRNPDSYIIDLFNNLDYEDSKAMTQEKEKKAIGREHIKSNPNALGTQKGLGGYTARFQQGGQMPQEGSQEELVLDFAVRYLVTMGVPETEIMDPQGNLNPEYQQELEQVFNSQEISWSDYAASPDEYMQQFIGNLQAQTQMARKGAKLKRLSKLRIYKK